MRACVAIEAIAKGAARMTLKVLKMRNHCPLSSLGFELRRGLNDVRSRGVALSSKSSAHLPGLHGTAGCV
jgi:hypothetical protein